MIRCLKVEDYLLNSRTVLHFTIHKRSRMSGFDTTQPAPRVNFELMSQYHGKRVRVVGKVEGVQGSILRIKAADDGNVEVELPQGLSVPADSYVEVDGTVKSPGVMAAETISGFGNQFGK